MGWAFHEGWFGGCALRIPRAVILLLTGIAMLSIDVRVCAQWRSTSSSDPARSLTQSMLAQTGRAPPRKPAPKKPRVNASAPGGVVKRESAPPLPQGPVFDANSNALKDITEALQRAKNDNRRVLIHWGSNLCDTCTRLHGAMTTEVALKRVLSFEYELVLVDVGSRERNLDIALGYGVAPQTAGIPWLTMLDSTGEPIANMHAGQFGDGRGGFDAEKLAKFLRGYQVRYPAAEAVLNRALAEARTAEKPLLVQFVTPARDRCRELQSWFMRGDVAGILDRNLHRVRIDVDRTVGGRDLLRRYSGAWQTPVPWFVLLNANDASVIATSFALDGDKSNFAGLHDDASIRRFLTLVNDNAKIITPQELEFLAKSLREMNNPPQAVAKSAPPSPAKPPAPSKHVTAPNGGM